MMETPARVAGEHELPTRGELRVLHVHSGNMWGGVETFLKTLAQSASCVPWMKTEFALCFDAEAAGELRRAGAPVHILGEARLRSPGRVSAARKALSALLRARRYDVVVLHSAWAHILFVKVVRERASRVVQYVHDVPNPMGWLDRWAARSAPDLVLVNSRYTAVACRWWFPRTPSRIVRCPVLPGGGEEIVPRKAVRKSLATGDDAIVILLASRMEEWKGHRLLLDALARLATDRPWVCWIAGGAQRPREAKFEHELRERVVTLGLSTRVKFLGQRRDVPSLMRAADIFCQPNVGPEPFGLVFVEALAAGLPVVTTAMGGAVEIVDARYGALVEPNARSLAASLGHLVRDDDARAALARACPARARELCDVESRVLQLACELADVAAQQPWRGTRAPAAFVGGRL
jgi:glycosyltransferase involved in cell wall biosynthesis